MMRFVSREGSFGYQKRKIPRRDVRRLPDTADSIFCPADMSVSSSASSGSFIVTESLDPVPFENMSCLLVFPGESPGSP